MVLLNFNCSYGSVLLAYIKPEYSCSGSLALGAVLEVTIRCGGPLTNAETSIIIFYMVHLNPLGENLEPYAGFSSQTLEPMVTCAFKFWERSSMCCGHLCFGAWALTHLVDESRSTIIWNIVEIELNAGLTVEFTCEKPSETHTKGTLKGFGTLKIQWPGFFCHRLCMQLYFASFCYTFKNSQNFCYTRFCYTVGFSKL